MMRNEGSYDVDDSHDAASAPDDIGDGEWIEEDASDASSDDLASDSTAPVRAGAGGVWAADEVQSEWPISPLQT